jgi:hypothetical protein
MLGGRSDDTDKRLKSAEIPANCGNPSLYPVRAVYRSGRRRRRAVATGAAARSPCQIPGGAGGEEQHCESTEHDQRHGHRRRAGGVDVRAP